VERLFEKLASKNEKSAVCDQHGDTTCVSDAVCKLSNEQPVGAKSPLSSGQKATCIDSISSDRILTSNPLANAPFKLNTGQQLGIVANAAKRCSESQAKTLFLETGPATREQHDTCLDNDQGASSLLVVPPVARQDKVATNEHHVVDLNAVDSYTAREAKSLGFSRISVVDMHHDVCANKIQCARCPKRR
jgi:hypothetical protein